MLRTIDHSQRLFFILHFYKQQNRTYKTERGIAMTIYIIRHAEPDYTHDSLTEKGWREARLLGWRFANIQDA